MILQLFGSLGIGLVWGWLAGMLPLTRARINRPNLKNIIAILSGLVALAVTVLIFLNWQMTLVFVLAALLSFLAHRSWRSHLRAQFARS